jgi:hypothetical protein
MGIYRSHIIFELLYMARKTKVTKKYKNKGGKITRRRNPVKKRLAKRNKRVTYNKLEPQPQVQPQPQPQVQPPPQPTIGEAAGMGFGLGAGHAAGFAVVDGVIQGVGNAFENVDA